MIKTVVHPSFGEITVLRTGRARRISVSVRPPGKVRLTLPALCPLKTGMAFIEEKSEWIEKTVKKMGEKYPEHPILPPYRTAMHTLELKPAPADKISGRISSGKITVSYPETMRPESDEVQHAVKAAILRALRKEAAELLPPMVEGLAREYGFRYRSVTVRATRSRWGSCSGRDDISLSVYLMLLPRHLVEYIILHELCHTKYKDHSEKFHRLLDSRLGGREKELIKEIRAYRPGIF